jgi:hypothetical protein
MNLLAVAVVACVIGSLALAGSPAFACSCSKPNPVSEELEQSDAVFMGEASQVKRDQTGITVEFKVSKAWKGVFTERVAVVTADSGASCGYSFEEGKEYLVYGLGKGPASVSLCSRTAPVEEAYTDLSALGPGYTPMENSTNPDNSGSIPILVGVGAAIAAGIAFLTLRRKTRK